MVQIKLTIALALAAAVIAPVAALPVTLALENGSVLYGAIADYFFLILYRSAELNTRDDSEMFERSFEHFE